MKVNELEQKLEELQATLHSYKETKPRPVGTLRRQLRDLNPYINHFASELRIPLTTSGWGGGVSDIFGRLLDETLTDEQVSTFTKKAKEILSPILNHIQTTHRAKNDEISLPDPKEDLDELNGRVAELEKYKKYIRAGVVALGILGISVGGAVKWLGNLQTAATQMDTSLKQVSMDLKEAEPKIKGLIIGGEKTITDKTANELSAAKKEIDAHKQLYLPVGTIAAYAGPIDETHPLPDGWLLCDGSPIDLRKPEHKKYEVLRDAIGKTWGGGTSGGPKNFNLSQQEIRDASLPETFNLPDLRGLFLRGANNGQSIEELIDPDQSGRVNFISARGKKKEVGSYQADATAMPKSRFIAGQGSPHSHDIGMVVDRILPSEGKNAPPGTTILQVAQTGIVYLLKNASTRSESDHKHGMEGGDKETRPKNAAVNWIIKY